jgi:CRISPR system Cascade subunit CasB
MMIEILFDRFAACSLGERVAKLAALIASTHYPTGDRAALRRWAPGQPVPMAFYRLWLHHLDSELPPESQTMAWMALVWGLAAMGQKAYDAGRPFGQALAKSKFSEGRLDQLLSAPEDARIDLFMSAVRFLASKGEGFDWTEGARFLLTEDAEKRETLHRRLAADFYKALPKGKE